MITSNEWKIHKKLQDAKTVYICPARGCDKSQRELKMYENLLEDGYNVKVVRTQKQEPVRLSREDIERIRDAIVDYDLYSNIVSPMYRDSIDTFIENEMKEFYRKERGYWKPKVRLDTIIVDAGAYFDWYRWHTYTNPYFTDMFKVEENE